MANSENLTDEIDSIVTHHIKSIESVFDDLKKTLDTKAAATKTEAKAEAGVSSSSSTNPNLLNEQIDIAQQRTKETCFTFILAITKWIRKEYSMPNQCAAGQMAAKSECLPTILENLKLD